MAYEIVPFKRNHVECLCSSNGQADSRQFLLGLTSNDWLKLESSGICFTACRDGEVVGCAGLISQWQGRAEAWAVLNLDMTRADMLFVHRGVRTFLDGIQQDKHYARIELTVLGTFDAGHHWAEMLGFIEEGTMKQYDPAGNTHVRYSRIST